MSKDVYAITSREGYEWALPVDDADFERFRAFDGTSASAEWRPVRVRILHEDEGSGPFATSDAPWMSSGLLVLRARALVALEPLLSDAGELLPLACDEVDLWAFNALCVADALDETRSEIVRFSSGRIMDVERYAFDEAALEETAAIFKLPALPLGPLLCSRTFVNLSLIHI